MSAQTGQKPASDRQRVSEDRKSTPRRADSLRGRRGPLRQLRPSFAEVPRDQAVDDLRSGRVLSRRHGAQPGPAVVLDADAAVLGVCHALTITSVRTDFQAGRLDCTYTRGIDCTYSPAPPEDLLYSTQLPIYGIPCEPWNGHPAQHQEEARKVIGYVPPFTWVATACADKRCLVREHLTIQRPTRLGYPKDLCIYCGLAASCMDHLIPEPWSGPAVRRSVMQVPSCVECNVIISDSLTFNITERRALAHTRLEKRNAKWLRAKYFTDAEVAEFGYNLRGKVQEGMHMRAVTELRLRWPSDPFYDLNAAQAVGIENPYVIGMLDDPFAQTA